MPNPYHGRPSYTFWKSGVTDVVACGVDPVISNAFKINPTDAVATVGSCFAQHISRTLVSKGLNYVITERYDSTPGAIDENYGVFPARFGNVYTSRQLRQLFDRAYGLFRPSIEYWRGKSGEFIDPFRPRIQRGGFASIELLRADRERHLAAVRQMFESCRVLVFTLGLTEAWISPKDGSAFPLAPGTVSPETLEDEAIFHNLRVGEVISDLTEFLTNFWTVNSEAKVILTVSPVSLIATFEDRHVLVSTIASKSILRSAAEEICRDHRTQVTYFPSYEIITGPQSGAKYFEPDLRDVTPEGVAFVMSIFERHFLHGVATDVISAETRPAASVTAATGTITQADETRMREIAAIVCDEEAIIE